MTGGTLTGVAERAAELRGRRTPYVLATVVRAERPTSAHAGDRAIVLPDGTMEGFVGGTCAESTVRVQALRTLRAGESTLLRIMPRPEPAPAEGLVAVANPCLSGGTLDIFLEAVIPPALVHVFGSAPVARALESVGAAAGFAVARTEDPATVIAADTAAVVVASHGRDERAVLSAALRAGVPYVGLVAGRRRGASVTDGLEGGNRVRTPAGLDIGARTAAEIALSVLAEILSVRPRAAVPAPAGRPGEAPLAAGGAPGTPVTESGGAPETPVMRSAAAPGTPVAETSGAPGTPVTETAAATRAPGAEAARGTRPAGVDAPVFQEAVDPVCGMTVPAGTAPRAEHAGRTWSFCGPGCAQAFTDAPERYADGGPR